MTFEMDFGDFKSNCKHYNFDDEGNDCQFYHGIMKQEDWPCEENMCPVLHPVEAKKEHDKVFEYCKTCKQRIIKEGM